MHSLCVLYLHHADDDLTNFHYEMIKKSNPTVPIVPLTFKLGMRNSVAMSINLPKNQNNSEWRNCDMLVYEWFRSDLRIMAERYLILESDTLCNMPIKEFYSDVWNKAASGAKIQTPQSNPKWRPFFEARQLKLGEQHLQGITPLCGILLSFEALDSITKLAKDRCLDLLHCELRIGMLLSRAGYAAESISDCIDQYISCFMQIPIGPGIWHKIKAKYPVDIQNTNCKIGVPRSRLNNSDVEIRHAKNNPFGGFRMKKNGNLFVELFNNYETRNESTIRIIKQAIDKYNIPDFDWIHVSTGDGDLKNRSDEKRILNYATATDAYENVCPDFTFDHWSQTGIDDYELARTEIAISGNTKPETDMLGWRGNVPERSFRTYVLQYNDKKDFDCEPIVWNRSNPGRLSSPRFISLADQVKKWRYLLDVEGNGWSARLKFLFFSKRVIFLQERNFKEWYFPLLKAWEHYVPLKKDLSDLPEKLRIIRSNEKLEEAIKSNAFSFAEKNLTRYAAINRWKQILSDKNEYRSKVRPFIFGIGLSRTGSDSLTNALKILGYDTCHWPRSMEELEKHEAVTDITVSCRFDELDRKYPNSKFIYTVRDMETWLRSCEKHWSRLKHLRGTNKIPPFAEHAEIKIYGTLDFNRQKLESAYMRHHNYVMNYFKERQEDLLIVNLTSGEGWEKICKFLGKPIPSAHFPYAKE